MYETYGKLTLKKSMSRNILLDFKIPIINTYPSVWGSEQRYLKGTAIKSVSHFVCTIINVRRKWRHLYGVLQETKIAFQ